jgi:hypothetical protein
MARRDKILQDFLGCKKMTEIIELADPKMNAADINLGSESGIPLVDVIRRLVLAFDTERGSEKAVLNKINGEITRQWSISEHQGGGANDAN